MSEGVSVGVDERFFFFLYRKCVVNVVFLPIAERIFKDELPICASCPGIVKPDIVFFGENLPEKFHQCILTDFEKCDLLIVLGSSLVVQPFASLVDRYCFFF